MSGLAKEVVDSYGVLKYVRVAERMVSGRHDIMALTLGFERGAVLVSAVGDDDTICRRRATGGIASDDTC